MSQRNIVIFTLGWLIINLIQSGFTEIIDDEAYYWFYSQQLAWGYFDHPPMIALLIKLGDSIFPNELGARLFPSILGAGTIYLILRMLKDQIKDTKTVLLIFFSVLLLHFHVAGFIATPDLPLVFFATLFFMFYRNYLEKDSPGNIILLSLTTTLMLYSKYHGFLVIGFTILSNFQLLTRRSFWLMAFLSIALYLPHILWQYHHDFVSFSYHLVDRNDPFQLKFIFEYLGNQLLLTGPFVGPILIYIAVARKTVNKFESALKFNLLGFFLFFLASSVRGHVEPHWTATAFVPLLLLAIPVIEQRQKLKKWLLVLATVTLPLIILIRIYLIVNIFPMLPNNSHTFHDKDVFMHQIEEKAGDRPVVFANTYQFASLYGFYTRKPVLALNNKHYRKNEYDLRNIESDFQGKEVLFFPRPGYPGCDSLQTIFGYITFDNTEYFCWFNRVEITLPDIEWEFKSGEKISLDLELHNPTSKSVIFCDSCSHKPVLVYTYFIAGEQYKAYFAKYQRPLPDLLPGEKIMFPVEINIPEEPGSYQLMISFGADYLPSGINGKPVKINVLSRSTEN